MMRTRVKVVPLLAVVPGVATPEQFAARLVVTAAIVAIKYD